MLTQQDSSGELEFYPDNTPTFALFSIYDIYLLAPGLASVANLENRQKWSIVLDFLRIAGEYGGTMNHTLDIVTKQVLHYGKRGWRKGKEKERDSEGDWEEGGEKERERGREREMEIKYT